MNYRKGKEAQERVKRKIKYILLAVFSAIIAGLCVFSAFVPAASWKYYFSLPKVVICGDGEMRVHCMDAKNGDCTLVELPDGKIVLIGGGADDGASRKNVLRFLNALKIKRIDVLIVPDATYRGNGALKEIVCYYTVDEVYLPAVEGTSSKYGEFTAELQRRGIPAYTSCAGELLVSDEYAIHVLYPLKDIQTVSDTLLFLSCGGFNMLLGGNYSEEALDALLVEKELALGNKWGITLTNFDAVNLPVKMNEITAAKFLEEFSTQTVLFSCQSGASYQPSDKLLTAVTDLDANIYRTDRNGYITLTVKNGTYTVSTQR